MKYSVNKKLEHFLNFFAEYLLDDDYFVDGDYKLYRTEIKCYA